MTEILITDDLRGISTPGGWEALVESELRGAGFTPRFWNAAGGESAPEARGILVNSPRIGAAELDRMPELRVLARFGSGLDTIDIPECERRGVTVRNIPGPIGTEMVGAITGIVTERLFGLQRKEQEFERRGWVSRFEIFAPGVAGTVVGIVGAGRIATRLSAVLRALGLRVCFSSANLPHGEGAEIGERLELDELCSVSDVVVVLSPLRDDTRGLVGAAQIARMRESTHLIAISRGGVVDQFAALAALQQGRIASLHLDVYDVEPNDPIGIPNMDGLTTTPHNAAWTRAFFEGTLREAVDIFREVLG